MKRLMGGAAIVAITIVAGSAWAKDSLPPNVTTKPYGGGKNQAIDTIDYSFSADEPVPFPRAKLCVAESITNQAVQLNDSAGSFVGRSGAYYQAHNGSTVQGGDIFKYVDDASKSLVAQGSISRQGGLGGIIGLAIRFDLEVSVTDTGISMKMRHIESAMKSTGYATNDGFNPIGVWTGSMYKKDIEALDGLAAELKSCMVG